MSDSSIGITSTICDLLVLLINQKFMEDSMKIKFHDLKNENENVNVIVWRRA